MDKDKVIDSIWRTGAVKLRTGNMEPFFVDRGENRTPIRIFGNEIFSNPVLGEEIMGEITREMLLEGVNPDFFVGEETSGIPMAVYLGITMRRPFGYISREPKEYADASKYFEGVRPEAMTGRRVMFTDTVLSQAVGKRKCVRNANEEGVRPEEYLVLVNLEQGGEKALKEMGVGLRYAVTARELVDIGISFKHLKGDALAAREVQEYLDNPEKWHMRKVGKPYKRFE